MPSVEELRKSFSGKSSDQLLEVINTPQDWSEEALEAVRLELKERGIAIPEAAIDSPVTIKRNFPNLFDRLVASVIDSLIINIPLILIGTCLFFSKPDRIPPFVIFTGIPAAWLYSALQESSAHMATIGKRTMKIKVLDENQNKISFAKASGRHFGKYISSIMYIGFIVAAFTKKHQALHDLLSGSVLYNE